MMTSRSVLACAFVAAAACGNFQATTPPPQQIHAPAAPAAADPDTHAIQIYWIGHATVLIRLDEKWILTDPNFSQRIGYIEKRRVAPGMDPADLPAIDYVLISHAHLDHLDPPSLAHIPPGAKLVIPPGVEPYLPDLPNFAGVVPLATWQEETKGGLSITAVPARHSNGRYAIDGLWNRHAHTGYVIQYGSMTVYFAGDTGYHEAYFKQIGERFDVDVALVPVGPANRPAWVHALRKHVHADPAEAMDIAADVGAQWVVPIHYGTFFKEPVSELRAIKRILAAHRLHDRVRMVPIGGSATFLY
jgi:L-ascorbate metabolism protein UlaG (beta-lactamase superfamily)